MKSIAAAALILSAILLAMACGGDDNAPAEKSTTTNAPASAIPDAAVKTLQDATQSGLTRYKWAAGCAWNKSVTESAKARQLTPVDLLKLDASKQWASGTFGSAAGDITFATVYDPAFNGTPATTLDRVDGAGFVCFKPKA